MSRRVIPRSVQFMGCALCGEMEKTLRRVGEDLLCSVCAGRACPDRTRLRLWAHGVRGAGRWCCGR